MEFRDLRSLVAVYDRRHFGKAANSLSLTQSAVSKSIQRLEKSFGATLFDRSSANVVPTTICESVVARARLILASVGELDQTVRMIRGLEIGSLSLGIGPAMSESYVTRAVAQLAQEHPGIQLDVRVDHWKQLSHWLVSGEIDLLVADVSDVENDQRFVVTPLPEEEFIWFCRAGHPLAGKGQVTREDLLEFPLATPRMPPWAIEWFQKVRKPEMKKGSINALPTIRCENYAMLKRMVLESDCLSVALIDTIHADLAEDRLVAIPVKAAPLKTNAGIVQVRDRTPSPLADGFIERVERLANEHRY